MRGLAAGASTSLLPVTQVMFDNFVGTKRQLIRGFRGKMTWKSAPIKRIIFFSLVKWSFYNDQRRQTGGLGPTSLGLFDLRQHFGSPGQTINQRAQEHTIKAQLAGVRKLFKLNVLNF